MNAQDERQERIALGLHDLLCVARSYHAADALLADYARLKLLAGEPLPPELASYAPTYVQAGRNEIIRESCPSYGPDDRADALEDA